MSTALNEALAHAASVYRHTMDLHGYGVRDDAQAFVANVQRNYAYAFQAAEGVSMSPADAHRLSASLLDASHGLSQSQAAKTTAAPAFAATHDFGASLQASQELLELSMRVQGYERTQPLDKASRVDEYVFYTLSGGADPNLAAHLSAMREAAQALLGDSSDLAPQAQDNASCGTSPAV